MTLNRFTHLEDLDDETLSRVLNHARDLEHNPHLETLRGKVLGLIFMNPSLRTLASCQAGMAQLGGSSFVLTPGQGTWGLETRTGVVMDGDKAEHIREAIPVLEQYADALGVRCFASGEDLRKDIDEENFAPIAEVARKPLINLESAFDHPCQALADYKTLDDENIPRNGGRFVLSWAWHPKPLPMAVPAAALRMATRRGMDVRVLRPEGFGIPESLMREAEEVAKRHGGSVIETDQRRDAMEGAHVIYAKSWTSKEHYGSPEREALARSSLRSWCIDEDWFENADERAIFMHCLPVRRNVVVSDAVLDGPRSRVIQEAGNRLHVFKSILIELLGS